MRGASRIARLTVGVIAVLAAAPSLWGQTPTVIAILPFEDRGSYGQDKEVFRALRFGIPAMIASELSGHPELRLADPARVARAMNAAKLERSTRLDAATAARLGKEAGARYVITGSFSDFYGRFRLDARIVDTGTGQILKVVSNADEPNLQDRTELYRILQTVGHKVLAEASPARDRFAPEPNPRVVPTEAITEFSLGLLYERRGDTARAAQHYTQATTVFPDYPEAREGVRRVR
jgi:TolB-like protein